MSESAASVYRCPECGSEQPEPGTCGRCPGTVREADSAASSCVHEWEYDEEESSGPWTGYIERCKHCDAIQQVPQ